MQLESLRCDFGRSNLAFEHIQKINFAQIGNNISQTKSWADLKNKEKKFSKRFTTFWRKITLFLVANDDYHVHCTICNFPQSTHSVKIAEIYSQNFLQNSVKSTKLVFTVNFQVWLRNFLDLLHFVLCCKSFW